MLYMRAGAHACMHCCGVGRFLWLLVGRGVLWVNLCCYPGALRQGLRVHAKGRVQQRATQQAQQGSNE